MKRLKLNEHLIRAGLPLHVSLVDVKADVDRHDHDFLEIALILAGSCQHETLDGTQKLSRGNVLLLRPGVWHAYRQCHRLRVGNCGIGLALRQRELAWTRDDPQLCDLLWAVPWLASCYHLPPLRLSTRQLFQCRHHLQHLDNLLRAPCRAPRAKALAHLLWFLIPLAETRTRAILAQEQIHQPVHPAVIDVIALLENDFQHTWTLEQLARHVNLDRSYFSRLFHRHCGLAPMAYLNRLRLEKAATMLLRTRQPVGTIAMRVGMFDANYFTRRFSLQFGLSPREMRKGVQL